MKGLPEERAVRLAEYMIEKKALCGPRRRLPVSAKALYIRDISERLKN